MVDYDIVGLVLIGIPVVGILTIAWWGYLIDEEGLFKYIMPIFGLLAIFGVIFSFIE